VVNANVDDDATLARQFEGMDAVVNLVGILHQSRRQTFEKVHVELPARVARACRAAGVARLLQMSALGASVDGPSEYLKSRGRGEAAVKDAAGSIPLTIFQPSIVIGADDAFLNMFAKLVQFFPVIPLAGPRTRFQRSSGTGREAVCGCSGIVRSNGGVHRRGLRFRGLPDHPIVPHRRARRKGAATTSGSRRMPPAPTCSGVTASGPVRGRNHRAAPARPALRSAVSRRRLPA